MDSIAHESFLTTNYFQTTILQCNFCVIKCMYQLLIEFCSALCASTKLLPVKKV